MWCVWVGRGECGEHVWVGRGECGEHVWVGRGECGECVQTLKTQEIKREQTMFDE